MGNSGVPSKGRNFFLSLTQQETGRGRGRTAQRGRSLVIPHALVHMRMGDGPAIGPHWRAVLATACRSMEGYRTPDAALVCGGRKCQPPRT